MASSSYITLVNNVLTSFNEVNLTTSNFSSATGFQNHVKDLVNQGVRFINAAEFEWPFNHAYQEDTLTAAYTDSTYIGTQSFPADLKNVDWDTFYLQRDDALDPDAVGDHLTFITYDEYVRYHRDNQVRKDFSDGDLSVPEFVYPTPEGGYGVTPWPNLAYTIRYSYYSHPTAMSAHSDTTSIPSQWEWLIETYAKMHCHIFRENEVMANAMAKEFKDGLRDMRTTLINKPSNIFVQFNRGNRSNTSGSNVLRVG